MRLLSILIIALASHTSLAASDAPQFLWQAGGGDHVIEAGYNYSNVALEVEGIPGDLVVQKNRMSLGYEYGFNDMMSLGLSVNYATGQTDAGPNSKSTIDGLENIALDFRGNAGLGFGKLYYGVNARISAEDFEREANSDSNATTGHHTIAPFVALALGSKKNNYGLKVSYEYNTETKIEDESDPTQQNLEAGHGLLIGAYYERQLSDNSILGFAVNYADYADYEEVDSGNKVRGADGLNNVSASIYGAVGCGCETKSMTFLPKVSYIMIDDETYGKNLDVESSGGTYAVEFAFRKEF